MSQPSKLTRFWQELKRRKVITILIAYLATCFAVIEFVDITSSRFAIPDGTVKLLYLIAAIGFPLVIILPWFINRKKEEISRDESAAAPETDAPAEKIELTNLPAQLTSFIGRENEMPIVRQLISEHRLVTLVGAGGCGKTRLACEVAAKLLSDYPDGVWFVDLAPIPDEGLVAKEITEALKIPEAPGQSIIDTLIDKIKDKNQLIILDNCEHLVRACAEVAGKLVQSVPGLKILATSRESLCVTGEQVWRVPSLTLIDPKTIIDVEQARDSEAVMMFADRARLNNPEFELETENVNEVVTICNKLDGIPLALELVASRTRNMNTHMILERFADRFEQMSSSDPGKSKRQQTLQATIEWSYNLLSDEEKLLFRRLAVFSGGFDIEAAEEVCSDDQLPKKSILDLLSRLVDQSLVYTVKCDDQSMRYKRLETLRQFAQQKLQSQKEEEAIRKRHLNYYIKMAEQSYEEQFELQLIWLNRLELEHDNMMAAMNWAEIHVPEEFVKLAGTLHWFWRLKYHYVLGKDYLERTSAVEIGEACIYARTTFGLGYFMYIFGNMDRAIEIMNESVRIIHKSGDIQEKAYFLSIVSSIRASTGDYDTAVEGGEESLELARKIGKPGFINHCLTMLCQVYIHSKKFDLGRPLCEELVISSEKLDHQMSIIFANHFLSDCVFGEGNFIEAEKHYVHAMKSALKFGNIFQAALEIQGIAFSLSGQSRWIKCVRLYAASVEQIIKITGAPFKGVKFWDEWAETYIGGANEKLGEELTQKYEEEGRSMGFDKAAEYAQDFEKD